MTSVSQNETSLSGSTTQTSTEVKNFYAASFVVAIWRPLPPDCDPTTRSFFLPHADRSRDDGLSVIPLRPHPQEWYNHSEGGVSVNLSLLISVCSLALSVFVAFSSWKEKRVRLKARLSAFVLVPDEVTSSTWAGLVVTIQNLSARYCEIHGGCLETGRGSRHGLSSCCEMQSSREAGKEAADRFRKVPSALQTDFPIPLAPYRARKMLLWVCLDREDGLQSFLASRLCASNTVCRTEAFPRSFPSSLPFSGSQRTRLSLRLSCNAGMSRENLCVPPHLDFLDL